MKQYVDKRIENATVGFKEQKINHAALAAMAECLELIANGFPENSIVSSTPDKKKGKCENGNIRKNKK
jgi:hypothetical protein